MLNIKVINAVRFASFTAFIIVAPVYPHKIYIFL